MIVSARVQSQRFRRGKSRLPDQKKVSLKFQASARDSPEGSACGAWVSRSAGSKTSPQSRHSRNSSCSSLATRIVRACWQDGAVIEIVQPLFIVARVFKPVEIQNQRASQFLDRPEHPILETKLKDELQRQLHLPRSVSRGDVVAKVRRIDRRDEAPSAAEHGMVQ